MRGLLAVARSEVQRRFLVIGVGAMLGVVPIVGPWLVRSPGLADDVWFAIAWSIGLAYAVAMAVLLGATVLAQDLVQRRLSFLFCRPISTFSIVSGRFLGAHVLWLVGAAVVLLPTVLRFSDFVEIEWLAVVCGVGFGLFPLAHIASVQLRALSKWLLLDVMSVLILFFAGAQFVQSMLDLGSPIVLVYGLLGCGVAGWLGLHCIAFLQLARGRTEVDRASRIGSWGLFAVAVLLAIPLLGCERLLTARSLDDLRGVRAAWVSTDGRWVALRGEVARLDYEPTFLWHPESGESFVPPHALSSPLVMPSIWSVPSGLGSERSLWSFRMDADRTPVWKPLGLSLPASVQEAAVSANGNRLAVLTSSSRLELYDLEDAALLKVEKLTRGRWSLRFAGDGELQLATVRLKTNSPDEVEYRELDPVSFAWTTSWSTQVELGESSAVRFDDLGERLLVGRVGLQLESGEQVLFLPPALSDERAIEDVWVLSDGSLLLAEQRRPGREGRITLYTATGEGLWSREVEDGIRILPWAHRDRWSIYITNSAIRTGAKLWISGTTKVLELDLATGESTQDIRWVVPLADIAVAPGSPATGIFVGSRGAVTRTDRKTGDREIVWPGAEFAGERWPPSNKVRTLRALLEELERWF